MVRFIFVEIFSSEHNSIFFRCTVVGLGFGMMSGAFSLVNVLADSLGPGTVGLNGEPSDFFMASAGIYDFCITFVENIFPSFMIN